MKTVESNVEEPGQEESGPANAENEVTIPRLQLHLAASVVHQHPVRALQPYQGRHRQAEDKSQVGFEGWRLLNVTPAGERGREESRDPA